MGNNNLPPELYEIECAINNAAFKSPPAMTCDGLPFSLGLWFKNRKKYFVCRFEEDIEFAKVFLRPSGTIGWKRLSSENDYPEYIHKLHAWMSEIMSNYETTWKGDKK
jgi:hypothetical protein